MYHPPLIVASALSLSLSLSLSLASACAHSLTRHSFAGSCRRTNLGARCVQWAHRARVARRAFARASTPHPADLALHRPHQATHSPVIRSHTWHALRCYRNSPWRRPLSSNACCVSLDQGALLSLGLPPSGMRGYRQTATHSHSYSPHTNTQPARSGAGGWMRRGASRTRNNNNDDE